jgi:hypothetical protein
MENKKKTKWFVETPTLIVDLMHKWLWLNGSETLADFTAWKWQLFWNYNPELCYGIEIDEENYNHTVVKYKNVILWDFFEKIENHRGIDALILNPPYIKSSNEIIYKSLQKLNDWWRFAIISKDSFIRELQKDYPDINLNISMAMVFDTNLFKPFAQVKTILILWTKWSEQWDFIIHDFSNDELQVNTRSKFVELRILAPKSTKEWTGNFWEKLNEKNGYDTIPTYEDFKNTVIKYMAFDTGFPEEFIRNPKKLWEWFTKLKQFGTK